jgi:error-prone DNA polymerase
MRLAEADALRSLAGDRRTALWTALGEERRPRELPLFAASAAEREQLPPGLLPALSEPQEVVADYQTFGMTLRAHPMSFHRAELDEIGILSAAKLAGVANNRFVRVAGLVILRQRPSTAKEITFVTLEDETGTINLVVKPGVWQQYYQIARSSNAWIAHGKLEQRSGVIHVVVRSLVDFSAELAELKLTSRDFH